MILVVIRITDTYYYYYCFVALVAGWAASRMLCILFGLGIICSGWLENER